MPTILIAGDYCPSHRVEDVIEQGNYELVFDEIKAIQADYKIVNFECAVAGPEDEPIKKCGPNLRCTTHSVVAIKYAGFDCVTLANNHFGDYGQIGVEKTIYELKKEGIAYVGGGTSLREAQQILYRKIGNKTVAFINCCEHEFSIATAQKGGSNPLNPMHQWYAIQDAKGKADYVIVIVHGGAEQYDLPLSHMVETYRFFVDAGASAVINHHQHCFSGYEIYKGVPIFYGLGNFCFDWNQKELTNWHKGYMVKLSFEEQKCNYELLPYTQCFNRPSVALLKDAAEISVFQEKMQRLNTIISDGEQLRRMNEQFMEKSCKRYVSMLEPYSSKIARFLFSRRLLPSFIKGGKKKQIQDIVMCESHRERLLYALKR